LQKTEVHTAPQSPFAVDGVAEIKPGYIIVYILPKGTELKVGR
jgi:hypothetical protein